MTKTVGRKRSPPKVGRPELLGRKPASPAFEVFVVLAKSEMPLIPSRIVLRLKERGVDLTVEQVEEAITTLISHQLIRRGYRVKGWQVTSAVLAQLNGKWPN